METIIVVSPHSAVGEDLKKFVSEWNGVWDGNPSLNHGVVQRDQLTIYCSNPYLATVDYSSEEITELAKHLGATPQTVVAIDISRTPGSQDLALEFAVGLAKRWGGLVDGNGVIEIEGGWQR